MAEPIEKWRALDQTMAEVRSKFADISPDALEALIDEALAALRKARSLATAELPEEKVRAIGASRMDARHAHLDDMLEE